MQDVKISLALGKAANTKIWKNTQLLWSEFTEQLKTSTQTRETLQEFLHASKDERNKIKDVGGYVGGHLRQGRRNPKNVKERSVLTLDVDFATTGFFELFTMIFDNAAFIHATHKHSPTEPRYRLLIPLDRPCTADEYVAVARKVAGDIGIDMFDNTTFEVNRLMFWPSHPSDIEYYWREQKGEVLSVDTILDTYKDWTDTSLWPTAGKKIKEIGEATKKQEDPYMKRGIVGAFCRTYDIEQAINTFLSDVYAPAADNRYSYIAGSTFGGLVIYDNTFAYSHHGTDPISGKLCNAFDLIRIHKFGHLDPNEKSKRSFALMEELAKEDIGVRKTLAQENYQEAREVFSTELEIEEADIEWMQELEINSKGEYLSTAGNINLVLQNDKFLKEAFRQNDFDNKRYVCKPMPWRKVKGMDIIRNVDYSGVRNYIECVYKINGLTKIEDALALEIERNSWHPLREYLSSLEWDKTPRIETLFIEYFGAKDNLYARQTARKWMTGAVKRIFVPGCKFDLVPVLVDPAQGSAKSTFANMLGRDWFSDTFMTVHGKEAFEQIQGAWIIEIAELAGLRKADVEAVKHFITKQRDQYRPAYGRAIETFERQCVFIGTTNNTDFLRDPSGNRRFLPIDVDRSLITKSVFDELPNEVDQLWAEAVHLFKQGEKTYLSPEVEDIARGEQAAHSETDERSGIIIQYLNTLLPEEWKKMDLYERRAYLSGDPKGKKQRKYVCIAEIWCECLGKQKEEMSRYNTREINDLMRMLPAWKTRVTTKNFSIYGIQRYFERI